MRMPIRWSILLAAGLIGIVIMLPAWALAQSPPPAPTPAAPTPTPTPTNLEFVGVDQPVNWLLDGWNRFGWWLIPIVVLVVVIWLLRSYLAGLGEGVKERGKKHVDVVLGAINEPAEARAARQQAYVQQQTGIRAYLTWVSEEYNVLPQKPLDEDDEQLLLEQVYVPLRVVERDQMDRFVAYRLRDFEHAAEQAAREAAFEGLGQSQRVFRLLSDRECLPAPAQQPRRRQAPGAEPPPEPILTERLLLVGEAGSGKTTTLHYAALMLARDNLNQRSDNAQTIELFTRKRYIPVYIKLTQLTRHLREKYRADRSRLIRPPADLLYEWLEFDLPRQHEPIPAKLITDRLKAGDCLVLFDGLDETGDTAERDFAKELITNLIQACPANRYVVASRPFKGVAQGLSDFLERHLSPLDQGEMRRLLEQWFQAVGASTRRRQRRSVAQELEEIWGRLQESPRLFDMATNPLLLTSMAILVHGGDTLPAERARLYDRLVDLTIVRWRDAELRRGLPSDEQKPEHQFYEDDSNDDVRLRLQVLAATMLQDKQRELALAEVRAQLAPIYKTYRGWNDEQCRNYINKLMLSLALHSGLIQERDEQYSFIHFTLQEYLAARHYDEIGDLDSLFTHRHEPRWRETILLAVGYWATRGLRERAATILTRLLDTGEPESLLLAAEALDEANARRVVQLGAVLSRTLQALPPLAALTEDWRRAAHPDPLLRSRAATLLDRLGGDGERPGLDLTSPAYWAQPIAPGVFSMGDDNGSYDDEKPQFDYTIRRPYALAKFPVTNRQYQIFVDALEERSADPEAQAAARQLRELMQQHDQTPAQFRPRYWPGASYRAGEGNHPVVGVTWYAATAFAWWADAWLRLKGLLAPGAEVRLPSEAEWERAAAYPLALPAGDTRAAGGTPDADLLERLLLDTRAGRRDYPWGAWDEVTESARDGIIAGIRANIHESGIRDTSPVGIFPHGAAACGAEELAGNVWEWCSTPFTKYPFSDEIQPESLYTQNKLASSTYVLRGGSWARSRVDARCAYRVGNHPAFEIVYPGFRLAHLFSLSSSS